jgi:hypothetical protein
VKAIFCKSISGQVSKTELVQNFEHPTFGGLQCLICIVLQAGYRYYDSMSLGDKCLDFKKATQYRKKTIFGGKIDFGTPNIAFLKNLK